MSKTLLFTGLGVAALGGLALATRGNLPGAVADDWHRKLESLSHRARRSLKTASSADWPGRQVTYRPGAGFFVDQEGPIDSPHGAALVLWKHQRATLNRLGQRSKQPKNPQEALALAFAMAVTAPTAQDSALALAMAGEIVHRFRLSEADVDLAKFHAQTILAVDELRVGRQDIGTLLRQGSVPGGGPIAQANYLHPRTRRASRGSRAVGPCEGCGTFDPVGQHQTTGFLCPSCYAEELWEKRESEVRELARQLGLPPVGLNADWSVSAWHAGPSSRPNRVGGDVYVLEDEEAHEPSFLVVRRWYVDPSDDPDGPGYTGMPAKYREWADGHNDAIVEIANFTTFAQAAKAAIKLRDQLKRGGQRATHQRECQGRYCSGYNCPVCARRKEATRPRPQAERRQSRESRAREVLTAGVPGQPYRHRHQALPLEVERPPRKRKGGDILGRVQKRLRGQKAKVVPLHSVKNLKRVCRVLEEQFGWPANDWAFAGAGPSGTEAASLTLVRANQRGHYPIPALLRKLLRLPPFKTYDQAMDAAEQLNELRGMSGERAGTILASSMFGSLANRRRRR